MSCSGNSCISTQSSPCADSYLSIDGNSKFIQLANAVNGAITPATQSSYYPTYLDVEVLRLSVVALINFLNGQMCPTSTNNPNAYAVTQALLADIPLFSPAVSIQDIVAPSSAYYSQYIRYSAAVDFTNDNTPGLTGGLQTTTSNAGSAFFYMCDSDCISPILTALGNYNSANTPDGYNAALTQIGAAITVFVSYVESLNNVNIDGYLALLYTYLTTPFGGAVDTTVNTFTLSNAGPATDQLNLALIILGEYNGCGGGNCRYFTAMLNTVLGGYNSNNSYCPNPYPTTCPPTCPDFENSWYYENSTTTGVSSGWQNSSCSCPNSEKKERN